MFDYSEIQKRGCAPIKLKKRFEIKSIELMYNINNLSMTSFILLENHHKSLRMMKKKTAN